MKKQLIKFGSLLVCVMLVLSTVVFAMPGESETPNKYYYGDQFSGSKDLALSKTDYGLTITSDNVDIFGNVYYNINGTAAKDSKGSKGNGLYVNVTSSANVYEMDFMLGNDTTGVSMRFNTDAITENAPSFDAFVDWKVGTKLNDGAITLAANKWYRVAVVYTSGEADTLNWSVYLDGVHVPEYDGEKLCTKVNYVRIYSCVSTGNEYNLSLDNVITYTTSAEYSAGATASISEVNAEVGILDAANNTIKFKRGITAAQLKEAITTDGVAKLVYNGAELDETAEITSDHSVVVRSADGRYTYYKLDGSLVKYDFDNKTAALTGYTSNKRVTDAERNSRVLQIASPGTSSAGFKIENLAFTDSYVISFDVKRETNTPRVNTVWNSASNDKVITINANSVQLFGKNIVNNGSRPGEWTRYAAYVDTKNKKAQLYINGEAVGAEVDLTEYANKITPTDETVNTFRFLVPTNENLVWVDDFEIYTVTETFDSSVLTNDAPVVTAAAENVSVTTVPGAMGKITGAENVEIENLASILTPAENVTLSVYAADGTLVESGAIEKGMMLKAFNGKIANVYTFTDAKAEILSQDIADGKINLLMNSYEENLVIVARYSEDGNVLLKADATRLQAGYYQKEVSYEAGEKVKVFVWDSIENLVPMFVIE